MASCNNYRSKCLYLSTPITFTSLNQWNHCECHAILTNWKKNQIWTYTTNRDESPKCNDLIFDFDFWINIEFINNCTSAQLVANVLMTSSCCQNPNRFLKNRKHNNFVDTLGLWFLNFENHRHVCTNHLLEQIWTRMMNWYPKSRDLNSLRKKFE